MPELIELDVYDLCKSQLERFLESSSASSVTGGGSAEILVAPQHIVLGAPNHLSGLVEAKAALCTRNDDDTYDLNVLAFAEALDRESIAALVLHLKTISERYVEGYEYVCGLEPADDPETQFFASRHAAS